MDQQHQTTSYNNAQEILADIAAMRHALQLLSQNIVQGNPQQEDLLGNIAERLISCQEAYGQSLKADYKTLINEYDKYARCCEHGEIQMSADAKDEAAHGFVQQISQLRYMLEQVIFLFLCMCIVCVRNCLLFDNFFL